MNIYKESFLILGKGMTYLNCKEFFDRESIAYEALETSDILNIKDHYLILKDKKINLSIIDHIIISPGISKKNSTVQKLRELNCKIATDIEILQSIKKSKYICITGTNGKTSTVNLISDILNSNHIKTLACGNNGVSVFKSLEDNYDFIVLELSSYQLDYIRKLDSHISVILNLSTDHLERHKTLKNYFTTKLKIFDYAKHKVINNNLETFEKDITFDIKNKSFYINNTPIDNLYVEDYHFVTYKEKKYELKGKHEAYNLSACITVLSILGLSIDQIMFGFSQRSHLSHRLERFCTFQGITYINDSKSTNADSTLNALESLEENIILIMGGDNKKISYNSLKNIIDNKVKLLILIGDNRKYIKNQLNVKIDTILLENLKDATNYIFDNLKSNHTVLLSPGSSSFSLYKDFEHRGNHFKNLVNNYVNRKA
jgi:UDP-N-acetylmuramoylalanine--D-glutamate ligase